MTPPRPSSLLLVLVTLLWSVASAWPATAGAVPPNAPAAAWVTNGAVDIVVPSEGGASVYVGGRFTYVGPRRGAGVGIAQADASSLPLARVVEGGSVYAAIPDGSGGAYIGGDFTTVGGSARAGLAHLNSDGTLDSGFAPSVTGTVHALLLSGTTIYVGGSFTALAGSSRTNLGSVSTTGTIGALNLAANGAVRALAITGSTLIVGGGFSTVGGSARTGYAQISTVTNLLDAAVANVSGGTATVHALTVDGSNIYAAGNFTSVDAGLGGNARTNAFARTGLGLAAWAPAPNGTVRALVNDGTDVFLGGDFTSVSGSARAQLAAVALTTTSTTLRSFNPGLSDSAGGTTEVLALAVSGTTLDIGGVFDTVASATRMNLASVTTTTGAIRSWDPVVGGRVRALARTGTVVVAGGDFSSVGGKRRRYLAEVSLLTGAPTTWNPDPDAAVTAIAAYDDVVYLGGSFATVGGSTRTRLAAASAFGTGTVSSWDPNANGAVTGLAAGAAGVYAAGPFTTVGGAAHASVARITAAGTVSSWDPAVTGGAVNAIALNATGGTLYLGGSFTSVGGSGRTGAASVDTSTAAVRAFDPAVSGGSVLALAVGTDTVYLGGTFSTIGGASRSRLAAVDGSTGAASSWNPGASAAVRGLALYGSTLYAAGDFTTLASVARTRLGGIDTTSGSATAFIPVLAVAANAVTTVTGSVVAGTEPAVPILDRGLGYYATTNAGNGTTLSCVPYPGSGDGCVEATFPATYAFGTLISGPTPFVSAEQRFTVVSNRVWDLRLSVPTVPRMTEYALGAYGTDRLDNQLEAGTTLVGGTRTAATYSPLTAGGVTLLSSQTASDCTTIAGVCQPIGVGLRFRQTISFADDPDTYRIDVAYDVSQPF